MSWQRCMTVMCQMCQMCQMCGRLEPGWLKTDMGGENAMYPVEDVLPGALVPALLDDNGASGQTYKAQDFRDSA